MNSTALYILFAILISVIAQATNTDLANNTSFLLLLLLALGAYGQNNPGRDNCYVYGQQRSFI